MCGGLFSDLLLESAALCGEGGRGRVGPSGSERLGGRFPCLGEQRCVYE